MKQYHDIQIIKEEYFIQKKDDLDLIYKFIVARNYHTLN